ncbi:hypothetical protein CXG81DRAFT_28931, partial [Caulochytrium protostelioides]
APSPPVNIVIKLHACNGRHVVKLSDDVGKHQGDAGTVAAVLHDLQQAAGPPMKPGPDHT